MAEGAEDPTMVRETLDLYRLSMVLALFVGERMELEGF